MADRVGLVISSEVSLPTKAQPARIEPDPTKGGDVYGWAMEQAALIRSGRFQEIDWVNVADEIESVAKSELRALTSNLSVILSHMLKWTYQPEMRSPSWSLSIGEHRARIEDELEDNRSLKGKLDKALLRAYRSARASAAKETDLPLDTFPAVCPYDWDAIMPSPFVLDQTNETP